ncbi:MAG TPA: SDR family NAD(P)-dependent oxidoreductase [Caulobacteraceae bacterium]|jgi:NAD(P)-dependent dehydrogenase (short-subunit alcohol dehydrogenase family)|nr:SDR family NAD(P)-dependent oxidoreductase [Caulobacteraceae bacterium]
MRDKVVVVTGAFGALGRTVASEAAWSGAKVAALDFAAAPPAGLAEALGTGALLLGGVDLAKPDEAAKAVAAVMDQFGRIDALINIAGGFVWQTMEGGDTATWERLHAMNVVTTLNACRAALPHLLASQGRIVNIGANAALKADAGMGAYAASKSGVHRLTEALAAEFKGKVAVNAVLPSIIDTPANRADMPDADASKWVTPQDLTAVILFLASDAARAVTGALVPVTGGV